LPPPLRGLHCGYAGGLGSDDLGEQLERIGEVAGEAEFWVDMESRVRIPGDLLDLGKVVRCLEMARPFVSA
jgi:hypothetical protein